ncbi:MAG: DoxX family protein [Rhodococcus sp. (in: high G+C Gram-positive bacteria)]|uniref:DoxX family protein n=1 Tax=Rhodococcus sp. TaxID=1831 RepID=UPI003D9B3B5A
MSDLRTDTPPTTRPRTAARLVLAAALVFAGLSHLFWGRKDFQAQVPDWVPMDKDGVVMASGGVEIMLGAGLAVLGRDRVRVGRIAALFFAAVFPGNLAQYRGRRSAFGLDTDRKRLVRLFFQPVLILWALWSTGTPRR